MNKIFLAAPISAFDDEKLYSINRRFLLKLIKALRTQYEVYSEIENIASIGSYDTPGKSAVEDFKKIDDSNIFILYHPMRVQTSAFIELGYAIAKFKKIIIISSKKDLPYLALGLTSVSKQIEIIDIESLSSSVDMVFKTIEKLN